MAAGDAQTILLILANDARAVNGAYLRALDRERRRIEEVLAVAASHGHCRVEVEPNATHAAVFDRITRHQAELVGVHFAGHADVDGLHLQDENGAPMPADVAALADRLARVSALRWVFLNGCGTAHHVAALHERLSVPVIATERAIRDDVAAQFAARFYRELGAGASLAEGFDVATQEARAKGRANVRRPGEPCRMLRPGGRSGDGEVWPWVIVAPPDATETVGWTLVRAASSPDTAAVRIRALDRRGADHRGYGVLIAPDRVLTAWALVSDDRRPRNDIEVTPAGRPPIAATVESHDAASGWALLGLPSPIAAHPVAAVRREPLSPGVLVDVGGVRACVIELEARFGYRRLTSLRLMDDLPEGVGRGAPVMLGDRVAGVLCDRQSTRGLMPMSRSAGPADVDARPNDPFEFPAPDGPLGEAIQIDRRAQWYELIALLNEEASGLIVFHGEASQAQYHFVARMQRDLGKKLHEPLRVVSVPYTHSSAGAVPTSAKEWAWRAADALQRPGERPVDAISAACEKARLVLVLDAPIRADQGQAKDDRAQILEFVEHIGPLILDSVQAHHRVHLMLAIHYPEPDWGFLLELLGLARVAEDKPWSFTMLQQTLFPGWESDVLPFLYAQGIYRQTVIQRLRAIYDRIAAECRSYERLARAVQRALDDEKDPLGARA